MKTILTLLLLILPSLATAGINERIWEGAKRSAQKRTEQTIAFPPMPRVVVHAGFPDGRGGKYFWAPSGKTVMGYYQAGTNVVHVVGGELYAKVLKEEMLHYIYQHNGIRHHNHPPRLFPGILGRRK